MIVIAERVNPFLGAGLFLVAPRAAKRGIEAIFVQRLLQRVGLHHIGVLLAAVGERPDASLDTVLIDIDQQLQAQLAGIVIAEFDHFAKLPCRVYMHQGERRLAGVKCLHRQVQHHGGVFADGIQHDGALEFGGDFSNDMDAFRFQLLEVG